MKEIKDKMLPQKFLFNMEEDCLLNFTETYSLIEIVKFHRHRLSFHIFPPLLCVPHEPRLHESSNRVHIFTPSPTSSHACCVQSEPLVNTFGMNNSLLVKGFLINHWFFFFEEKYGWGGSPNPTNTQKIHLYVELLTQKIYWILIRDFRILIEKHHKTW